jgi:hypothetical protein
MFGILNSLPRFATLLLVLLLSGCGSPGPARPSRAAARHFHEESAANLVVSFPGWQAISITRPDTSQDGFLPFYNRAQALQALRSLKTEHNLAVVVCSFNYTAEQESEQRQAWRSILGGLGFRRVVFLRAGPTRKLNGLLVVEDASLPSPAQPGV